MIDGLIDLLFTFFCISLNTKVEWKWKKLSIVWQQTNLFAKFQIFLFLIKNVVIFIATTIPDSKMHLNLKPFHLDNI